MSAHFQILVWGFRAGILCFGNLLVVGDGPLRHVLVAVMVPATSSLFASMLFVSLEVLRQLTHSYEFWFTSTINALNWIAFAAVLKDIRCLMAFLGWFSFQLVITVDACYRTFSTAVNSMIMGVPIVLALCGLVALHSIQDVHIFRISVIGYQLFDANDILGFTSTTLGILLAKMIFLKKRRVRQLRSGYNRMPCAFMKTTLRLVAVTAADSAADQSRSTLELSPRDATEPYRQRFKLSPLSLTVIDGRQTLLPISRWQSPPSWVISNQNWLRLCLYLVGLVGYIFMILQLFQVVIARIASSRLSQIAHDEPIVCDYCDLTNGDRVRILVASACSSFFCGVFAIFYQRDLLPLLLTNFDYVFLLIQVIVYGICVVDTLCWRREHSLVIWTWTLWLAWALSTDALTPIVKKSIFRFPNKLAAVVLVGVLLSGSGTIYAVLSLNHNRVLINFSLSSTHSFALSTRSVMVGRMATISLWCSRQVYVLFIRRDDELHLIRGLVEYDSPYSVFPRKHNKHTPVVDDL